MTVVTVFVCMNQVMEMDISKQLHAYEVEYHVLQDEMIETGPLPDDSDRLDKLEKTNAQLKKQNMELLEKLQVRRRGEAPFPMDTMWPRPLLFITSSCTAC